MFPCASLLKQSHIAQTKFSRNMGATCYDLLSCRGSKPDPPERGQVADLPLYVALFRDECSLYMDLSGDSLHKRGYRTAMHASSLNESAAAGVLSLASCPDVLSQGKLLHASLLFCCIPQTFCLRLAACMMCHMMHHFGRCRFVNV